VTQAHQVRQMIALTGQYAAVDETLTRVENLMLIGRLLGQSRQAARRRATELLEEFALGDAGGRAAKTYSGGMRRRLDLAPSLVGRPRVVYLDEPTTGLDPRGRGDLWRAARRPRRRRSAGPPGPPRSGSIASRIGSAQPRPNDLDGLAEADSHLQRAQDADPQVHGHAAILPLPGSSVWVCDPGSRRASADGAGLIQALLGAGFSVHRGLPGQAGSCVRSSSVCVSGPLPATAATSWASCGRR
jgi:ABC transporter